MDSTQALFGITTQDGHWAEPPAHWPIAFVPAVGPFLARQQGALQTISVPLGRENIDAAFALLRSFDTDGGNAQPPWLCGQMVLGPWAVRFEHARLVAASIAACERDETMLVLSVESLRFWIADDVGEVCVVHPHAFECSEVEFTAASGLALCDVPFVQFRLDWTYRLSGRETKAPLRTLGPPIVSATVLEDGVSQFVAEALCADTRFASWVQFGGGPRCTLRWSRMQSWQPIAGFTEEVGNATRLLSRWTVVAEREPGGPPGVGYLLEAHQIEEARDGH